MHEWNLKSGDPLALTLAADARLCPTDYGDDQIWELKLGEGEPPALALQTTFGLRARSLRLFPRFTEGEEPVTDPASFAQPPSVKKFFPNYLIIRYSPFPNIDVEAEYWVPSSKGVAGRLHLTNQSDLPRSLRVEWIAQLTPNNGQRMSPVEIQAATILSGVTDELKPVVFMTAGIEAGTGSYPSLRLELNLSPGEKQSLTWSHAALDDQEASFTLARNLAAQPWEAEVARLELLNSGLVDIRTGNPDWDAAFALSQKAALGLFVGPTEQLPEPSFVITRLPDQGFSLRGDGSDYSYLWSGQTPLDAYYLSGIILPSDVQLAKGLVRNFLATQSEEGVVDWKPGLAGQRSGLQATPLLATLAWKIYEASEDRVFLEEVFPGLYRFIQAWFATGQDRDGDGIPEWDNSMQTGFEDHPTFSRWHPWSHGVDIDTAESPALNAFLFRECQSLLQAASVLGRTEPVPALQSLAEHLCTSLEAGWDEQQACFYYWDRDTHQCTAGEKLGERSGPGTISILRSFEPPVRPLLHIQTGSEATRQPQVILYGESASGQPRIEKLTKERFKWYIGKASLTGERVYSRLEEIEIQGLEANDQITVYSVDYRCQDHTLLLPIWARMLSKERAEALVKRTIISSELFWRPFGIPACPKSEEERFGGPGSIYGNVNLQWNTLIGEGLLSYDYTKEAVDLFNRLMEAVCQNLKDSHAFRRYYHAETGQGSGEWNALGGLAPLGFFMEILGVRLISPFKVAIKGFNLFPWPVTVKYRGMTILRQRENSSIIFPDGQTISINDPAPQVISLEKSL